MNCKYCAVIACDGYGQDHEPERCEFYTRMSKADRIRHMTDEELAEFLETLCPSYNWTLALNGMTWFGWLEQEATNVN